MDFHILTSPYMGIYTLARTNRFDCIISDPSEMRESWKLTEGFVAEEGKSLLPHLAKARFVF